MVNALSGVKPLSRVDPESLLCEAENGWRRLVGTSLERGDHVIEVGCKPAGAGRKKIVIDVGDDC